MFSHKFTDQVHNIVSYFPYHTVYDEHLVKGPTASRIFLVLVELGFLGNVLLTLSSTLFLFTLAILHFKARLFSHKSVRSSVKL